MLVAILLKASFYNVSVNKSLVLEHFSKNKALFMKYKLLH